MPALRVASSLFKQGPWETAPYRNPSIHQMGRKGCLGSDMLWRPGKSLYTARSGIDVLAQVKGRQPAGQDAAAT